MRLVRLQKKVQESMGPRASRGPPRRYGGGKFKYDIGRVANTSVVLYDMVVEGDSQEVSQGCGRSITEFKEDGLQGLQLESIFRTPQIEPDCDRHYE